MKFFGYINKKNVIYLTAYVSDYEFNGIRNKDFVKNFINVFESANIKDAYDYIKKLNKGSIIPCFIRN